MGNEWRKHEVTDCLENAADNAVFEHGDIEVDEESDTFVRESEIGDELSFVYGKHLLNGFEFNNDSIGYEEVDSKASVEAFTLVHNRKFDLTLKLDAAPCEFAREAHFIRGFQESRAKVAMHFNRGTDDQLRLACMYQRAVAHCILSPLFHSPAFSSVFTPCPSVNSVVTYAFRTASAASSSRVRRPP